MQVQKIGVNAGVNKNNTSFGYNPEINAALVHQLEAQKRHKGFYKYIKNLILTTNEAEKDLRLAEKKNTKRGIELTLLTAAFIPLKVQITDLINRFFPNFDYRKKELESYQDEIKIRNLEEKPAHWMNTIAEILHEQEFQDRAEVATYVLQNVMKEQFPDLQFDFSGLTGIYKQKYMEEEGEYEDYDNEPEDPEEVQKNIDVNVNKNINDGADKKDLAERIALGKSKVFQYEPKDENELKGFASLGGMTELKKQLTEDIIIPLKDPAKARYNEKHYGIKMPNGILFYGPPGCGKTTIVERLSVETGLPLLELTTDSFGSEYINGSEINLGAVFDYAASIASEEKPVILFIDDVDAIVGNRSDGSLHQHKKSELGVFLKRVQDAPKNNIIVMAATNNYDGIDKAFTSRLRQQIYTGLPDKDARKSIIEMKLRETDNGQNLANDEKALDRIADLTENFPIRALEDFATETRKMAFVNGIRDITLEDYETVISKPESQNKKLKEENYKTGVTRKSIGFGK